MTTKRQTHRAIAVRVETIQLLDRLRAYTRRSRPEQIHVLVEQALGKRPAEQLQYTPRMPRKPTGDSPSGAGDATPTPDEQSPALTPNTGGADG